MIRIIFTRYYFIYILSICISLHADYTNTCDILIESQQILEHANKNNERYTTQQIQQIARFRLSDAQYIASLEHTEKWVSFQTKCVLTPPQTNAPRLFHVEKNNRQTGKQGNGKK